MKPIIFFASLSWTVLPAVVFSQDFIPGGIDSVEIQRIVPDTIAFDPDGLAALGNWEPQASVLGNTTFLIESNTFAEGTPDMQRFGLIFQPAAGGDLAAGEVFFSDAGDPYRDVVNNYRQNGNPGRVAGDRRPGAMNFIAGGEASLDEIDAFRSDNRWDTGVVRNGRFAAVQTFSLDPETLEQEPLCKAFDAINGRLESGDPGTNQIGRFGGELTVLDDGNFLVVVDDRSRLHLPDEKVVTAVIVDPAGAIVKESFVIVTGEIWSNVAAFKGGFCVRVSGILRFFDNAGELVGEVDQADPNLVDPLGNSIVFNRGRGDETRIAAHINSPYVYLAGPAGSDVRLAVWDSRDLTFVASVNVNELSAASGGADLVDFRPVLDRVNLAVDALDRVCVAYCIKPVGLPALQVAARILAFDEEAKAFVHLTNTFFPFVNYNDGTLVLESQLRTVCPSVAMTTREICIAAKGEINSVNDPSLGADTPMEVNFYTVFGHPDPQDDPTPPVGGFTGLFRRGDSNNDGKVDISDTVFLLGHLFLGGPVWACEEGSDTNDDGKHDISDGVFLLTHLFLGGAIVPPPFPDCGGDPGGAECPASSCNG